MAEKKLDIGFHPYTFVRSNVMRSKLLQDDEYQRLMKMKVPEITKRLQELDYREDINALGGAYSSTELIEHALTRNLERRFQKLRSICQEEDLLELVDAYLKRYDVFNIKTVLRAIKTGRDEEEAERLLIGAGVHEKEIYENALQSESVEEALERLSPTEFISDDMKGASLVEIENQLDQYYYESLLKLADRIPEQASLFRQFLNTEIEKTNLLTLLRLKREEVPDDVIEDLLVTEEEQFRKPLVKELLKYETVDDVLEALKESRFSEVLEDAIEEYEETGSFLEIERSLQRRALRKAILLVHQNLLSVQTILGYMFAKEVEVKNLRTIIKGKKLGVDEDFLERELIT